MAQRDTIVVGASAGGVEALRGLLGGLPADLPAAVLVVLHTPPSAVTALPAILARSTALRVRQAEPGDALEAGTVLVARPDHHLMVVDGHVLLTRGPRENGHRPAVDVLFRSAAQVLGPRVLGVILSGSLDDGSAGLLTVRTRGGVGLVQDPAEALASGMPRNAIEAAAPEHVLPLTGLSRTLVELAGTDAGPEPGAVPATLRVENGVARMRAEDLLAAEPAGVPAGLSCPDCHGSLYMIDEEGYVRYRCRVGHAWSAESLRAQTDAALEGALWMALRVLEEKAALARVMAQSAAGQGRAISAERFVDQAADTAAAADLIRRMLMSGEGLSPETRAGEASEAGQA